MMLRSKNVDRGWAWAILFACCSVEFLSKWLEKSLSVLLPVLTDQFQTHTWIIGLSITLIGSVKDFASPAVCFLAIFIDHRLLGMTGGVIVGLSITCASFVSDVRLLVLFLSFFNGIGFALVRLTSTVILSQYFDELYPLATGMFYSSGSIGLMICAPVTQIILEAYGWRGAMLLLGGMFFHLAVCSALFRNPTHDRQVKTSSTPIPAHLDDEEFPSESNKVGDSAFGKRSEQVETHEKDYNKWVHLLGLHLFKNSDFIAISLAMATLSTSMLGWTVYFIPYCLTKGLTPYESTFAVSIAGFTYLLGHFMYVPLLKRNVISVRCAIYISGLIAGIVICLDKFTTTFIATAITNSIFTCGIAVDCLLDVYMKSVLDQESLAKAFGWRTAVSGLFKPLPGFVVGWIYEHTGSYDGGFFFIGVLSLSAVFILGVDHLREQQLFTRKGWQTENGYHKLKNSK